jgi:hypothetical protein
MRLTDDELRDVLQRAEEIQRTSRHGDDVRAELEAVIGAGEAVGLQRSAIERALRERLDIAPMPDVGALAWAKSADGKYYVAEVMSISADTVRVRFLRGSEHVVAYDEVRSCSFIPGERVAVYWPWWGPWTCKVLAYDASKQRVKVDDGWGSTKTFPVAEVWQAAPRRLEVRNPRTRMYVTLLGAGGGIGALIGSILTALLVR